MYKELAIDALILSTQWGMDFTFFPLPSNFSIAPKQSLLYNVKFGSKIYIMSVSKCEKAVVKIYKPKLY